MIGFRHADNRFPPQWETNAVPAARWHAATHGLVQYFADTPDGAWAEFLRHEEITDPADLATVERAMWAIDLPEAGYADVELSRAELVGGLDTHTTCQAEAARLRTRGETGLRAPSAALMGRGAAGWRVDAGLQPGPPRDGWVYVLFGRRTDLIGWLTAVGRPAADLLPHVRQLTDPEDP